MITPGELNDGTILRYAKGLGLTKVAGRKAIHHGGGINGFLSQSLYFPEEDLTVVVLANTAGPISPSELAENIAIEILGSVAEEKITLDLSKNEIQKLAKVYSGVARGRKVNVEIAIDSNNLTYLVKNAEEKQGEAYSSVEDQSEPKILVYSGNGIFRDGRTNFIFQSRENDIEELRMDFGSGYSILKAN